MTKVAVDNTSNVTSVVGENHARRASSPKSAYNVRRSSVKIVAGLVRMLWSRGLAALCCCCSRGCSAALRARHCQHGGSRAVLQARLPPAALRSADGAAGAGGSSGTTPGSLERCRSRAPLIPNRRAGPRRFCPPPERSSREMRSLSRRGRRPAPANSPNQATCGRAARARCRPPPPWLPAALPIMYLYFGRATPPARARSTKPSFAAA